MIFLILSLCFFNHPSVNNLQGIALVTIQAYSKDLQPEFSGKFNCLKGGKAFMFYGSLCLLALGTGGVKGALPALGGDQFDRNEQNGGALSTYYNWFLLSSTTGALVGVTLVVWVSMNKAWYWGFFMGTVGALIGFIVLALGKPFFRFQPLGNSPFIKIAQVCLISLHGTQLVVLYAYVSSYKVCMNVFRLLWWLSEIGACHYRTAQMNSSRLMINLEIHLKREFHTQINSGN